jgi:hypothetical protein
MSVKGLFIYLFVCLFVENSMTLLVVYNVEWIIN